MTHRPGLAALILFVALTRLAAAAPALFDWDEASFALAVREYDIGVHHPHPPGYPLFIGAGKFVAFFGVDPFRALQLIVLISAMAVFPALLFLAREAGFTPATALGGALLFAFLPNVMVYGGTALSDVPAATLTFLAAGFLLRGRGDSGAFLAGAVLMAMTASVRPASVIACIPPFLLAIRGRGQVRDVRAIVAGCVAVVLIVATMYGGAALASTGGLSGFLEAVARQSEYVQAIDSWRNAARPPLFETAKTFLVFPFRGSDAASVVLASAALASAVAAIVRRRRGPLLVLAMFAPLAVLSWLNLLHLASSRYAIAYMAMHALLAADAFSLMVRPARVQVALCLFVAAAFAIPAASAVAQQRREAAPPIRALIWVRDNLSQRDRVYVHASLRPQAEYVLPGRELGFFDQADQIPGEPALVWVVEPRICEGGINFEWERRALWKIVQRRNFEGCVWLRN